MRLVLFCFVFAFAFILLCLRSAIGTGQVAQRLSSHVLLRRPGVHWFRPQMRTWHYMASHAVAGIPRIKERKMGTDVSSGPVFLSKKRKIGPELTSMFVFLSFIRGMPATAWLLPSSAMSAPGIQTGKPQAAEKRNMQT